jgi:DNA-directed RNA polymerase specialized sigma24 family protein
MTLTNDTLAAARKLKPAALEALLAAGYAPARRVAHALSGDEAVARGVAELCARRSFKQLPKWQDPSSPENWFYHHAVLTTRANVPPPPADPLADPLVAHAPQPVDPAYVAFVRAIRNLPPQQREAFILHQGERLNPRMLGVAMDCSMGAADTHLRAATDTLAAVTGGPVEPLAERLTRAYAGLQAAQPRPEPSVRVHIRRVRRRLWLRRIVRFVVITGVCAGLGWLAWAYRSNLRELWRSYVLG